MYLNDQLQFFSQIDEDLLSKEHAECFKEQVREVIQLVKENPAAAQAMAQAQQVSDTPATSPEKVRKLSSVLPPLLDRLEASIVKVCVCLHTCVISSFSAKSVS